MTAQELIPEWAEQSGVLIVWPHPESDWCDTLPSIERTFVQMAVGIAKHEKLLIGVFDQVLRARVVALLQAANADLSRIHLEVIPSNDTWARDFGPITVQRNGSPVLLDFGFNGWGQKFDARLDNTVSQRLSQAGCFGRTPIQTIPIFLEGGSIEYDGAGTLLTTRSCLLTETRNPQLTERDVEEMLKELFGLKQILWLDNSFLAGDDTDGHVDMLARFAPNNTIVYVQCTNVEDEHYAGMRAMEIELRACRNAQGQPYKLIPLPFADARYDASDRLPLSFANYLIINGAVIVPQYGVPQDEIALQRIAQAHPGREMIAVDAMPAIRQGGSLHCLTMQLPKGVL